MLPRERVLAALCGDPTDRIPVYHVGSSSAVASMLLDREAHVGGGVQQWREAAALWEGEEAHRAFLERSFRDAIDLSLALGNDILRVQYWRMARKPARREDEYTFLYGDPEGTWTRMRFHPPTETYGVVERNERETKATTFAALEERVKRQEEALNEARGSSSGWEIPPVISRALEEYGDRYAIRVDGGGLGLPYSEPIWLEATLARPDIVARYLDVAVEREIGKLDTLRDAGVKMVFGGGDFASNEGPFYSPQVFRELMLPRLKRLTTACHRRGLHYLFASDGNLWPVADDLFGASGVDGFYEIDRRAGMDLGRLRERFPHLTLIGNISSHTLHRGTPDEVRGEVLSSLEQAHRSGGIIVGVSNYLMPGTPRENIRVMLESIEKNR